MKLPLLLLSAAALAVPGGGAQAHSAPALKHTSAKLRACDAQTHSAMFQGAMSAHSGVRGLEMRFTLQARPLEGGRWARVGAPDFERWLAADPGKQKYVYDKGVSNLPVGSAYRAVVRFRFRDAEGAIIQTAKRRTRQCRQPDTRPNLTVSRLRPGPLNGDGTREYTVAIENTGDGDAPAATLALDINGARYSFDAADVAAGDMEFEVVDAPACSTTTSVTATADAAGTVEERDETDNAVTIPCGS